MSRTIVLPRGHKLVVDDADFDLVNEHKWHAIPARSTFYAQAANLPNITAHRLVMCPESGQLVDHINRNGLDNRRANLRLATHSQNHANRPAPATNTSGYKGVSRTASGRWNAYITVDYKRRNLGTFTDLWDAAQAYNAAAVDAWGDFALLNTKDSGPAPVGPAAASPAPHGAAQQLT